MTSPSKPVFSANNMFQTMTLETLVIVQITNPLVEVWYPKIPKTKGTNIIGAQKL
ncbi:MAG: hypothetical protein AB8B66_03535 [Rickettsiaceae bacterium]